MLTCKVIPDSNICSSCLDTQSYFNLVEDCEKCEYKNKTYDLISVGSSFWGTYAIVSFDGRPEKVKIRRIRDVKEVK